MPIKKLNPRPQLLRPTTPPSPCSRAPMTTIHNPTLVLFDIDGTLLVPHGAGRRSFIRAIEAVFGWRDDIEYISFAGATDILVLRQIFAHHGQTLTDEDLRRFFEHLPLELERSMAETKPEACPGVHVLIETLAGDPGTRLGLVTGNIEACARIKLQGIGLHSAFPFGAFGEDEPHRSVLAALALRRADAFLPPGGRWSRVYLVGDAPSDVEAAKHIGAVSVAVATGQFDAALLQATGADHVLENLANLERLRALLGQSSGVR